MWWRSYNLGQNIVDKFTKLNKINFSTECRTYDFCNFLAQLSKFIFCVAGWVLSINSKHFKDFLEISYFSKILPKT